MIGINGLTEKKKEKLYNMNAFIQKKSNSKWIWISSDGTTKNHTDYVLSKHRDILENIKNHRCILGNYH